MRLFKIFLIAFVAVLSTTHVAEAQQHTTRYTVGDISNNEIADSIGFDLNAPVLTEGDGKLYYIRRINLHGVKYLNHDILKSSAGLVFLERFGDTDLIFDCDISKLISFIEAQAEESHYIFHGDQIGIFGQHNEAAVIVIDKLGL